MYSIRSAANSVNTTRTWIRALKFPYRNLKRTWPAALLCFTVTACSLFVGLVGPLRMDHPSFHWRVPRDLERVEPCIPWQGILRSPAKRPPPPATRLLGRHGRSSVSSLGGCWGRVEGERCLLPGYGAAQDTASEPRNIPPPLRNLLPGAPRSWALYQMVPTSYSAIWPSLAHHHVTPAWSSPLLLSLQRKEQCLPRTEAALQPQRNSSHFS